MTVEQELAVVSARKASDSHQPYSVAWWEGRTPEELRDIINRGFAQGPAFSGAVAEVERRAREETRRLRDLAAADALRRKKRKQVIWGAAIALPAIATLLGYWLGG